MSCSLYVDEHGLLCYFLKGTNTSFVVLILFIGSGIELSGWQHRDPSGRLAGTGIVMVPCYELRAEGEAALGL